MNPNLEVRKIEPGTPEYERALAMKDVRTEDIRDDDPRTVPVARSVSFWVDLWGGYSKTLKAPDGTEHHVDLLPWRGEDEDTTLIKIRIKLLDSYSPEGAPHR